MAHEHTADEHAHDHDHHGPAHGWRRWVFATNHKDIGTMYLVFACVMFFIGGLMAMVIRAELCGQDHGFMPIVVEVKSPADYDAWLRAKQAEQKAAGVAPNASSVTASAAAPVTQQ